jgi:hypothetical protein
VIELAPLRGQLRYRTELLELVGQRWFRGLLSYGDGGQWVGPLRCLVFQGQLPGLVDQHVDNGALRRREQNLGDELLMFYPAAVAANELHPNARQPDVEDPAVGCVRQPQSEHLTRSRGHRQVGLATDEQ